MKCWCGCGTEVSRRFAVGHDSRYKSALRAAHHAGQLIEDPEGDHPIPAAEIAERLGPYWLSFVQRAPAAPKEKKGRPARDAAQLSAEDRKRRAEARVDALMAKLKELPK